MKTKEYINGVKICQEQLRNNATKAEKKLIEVFNTKKIKYNFQHIIAVKSGKRYIVDFFLPNKDTVIEVDGGYHNKPEQVEKDRERKWDLERMGYKVLRIRNEQLTKKDIKHKEILEILDRKFINYLPSIYYNEKVKHLF